MKKFRLLHVIRSAEGGMKNHLLALLTHLNQDLFELIVACPDSILAQEARNLGIKVVFLPIRGELSLINDWMAIRSLTKILKDEDIAIIHVHSSRAGFIGRVAAYFARIPVIFMTAHNSIFYEEWSLWKKLLFARAEGLLGQITDRIITVSEALRKELMEKEGLDPAKVITIHNGIETRIIYSPRERRYILRQLGLPQLGQIVGTVARLAPQKGITYFLKAAAMLAKDYQVNFVVIGDGPLRRQLESEAFSLGLERRFIFAGERQDVLSVLPVMDVFVLPSLTEGFPLTVLEALAAGRPVVATKVGGIPEIIQNDCTGLLVEPGDPAALALAIATLLTNKQKALKLAQAGQLCVKEKFTVERMVLRLEEEYKKALMVKGLLLEQRKLDVININEESWNKK